MNIGTLLTKLFILTALMLLGYLGARRGTFTAEFNRVLSHLALNICLPATILHSFITSPVQMTGGELAEILGICAVCMLISFALGALCAHILPIKRRLKGVFELLIAVSNCMFVGLPVAMSLYGEEAVLYMALVNVPFNVLLYTYGVVVLNKGSESGGKSSILKALLSTPFVATILGVVLLLLPIRVPEFCTALLSTVNGATVPLSMIVVGAALGKVDFLAVLKEKSLYVMSFMRLLAAPVLTYFFMKAIGAPEIFTGTMVIMAASPCAVVVSVLTQQYGADTEYASEGIAMTTILSMLTIPLVAMLLL